MKDISLIVAIDSKNGFAKNNTIPWFIKEDLKTFQRITTSTQVFSSQNAVIMGRRTFESLNYQPLKNRVNIVLTSTKIKNVLCYSSLKEAIDYCTLDENIEKIFIIGGENVYNEALNNFQIETIYKTQVQGDFKCDKFFILPNNFKLLSVSMWNNENINKNTFRYEIWVNANIIDK